MIRGTPLIGLCCVLTTLAVASSPPANLALGQSYRAIASLVPCSLGWPGENSNSSTGCSNEDADIQDRIGAIYPASLSLYEAESELAPGPVLSGPFGEPGCRESHGVKSADGFAAPIKRVANNSVIALPATNQTDVLEVREIWHDSAETRTPAPPAKSAQKVFVKTAYLTAATTDTLAIGKRPPVQLYLPSSSELAAALEKHLSNRRSWGTSPSKPASVASISADQTSDADGITPASPILAAADNETGAKQFVEKHLGQQTRRQNSEMKSIGETAAPTEQTLNNAIIALPVTNLAEVLTIRERWRSANSNSLEAPPLKSAQNLHTKAVGTGAALANVEISEKHPPKKLDLPLESDANDALEKLLSERRSWGASPSQSTAVDSGTTQSASKPIVGAVFAKSTTLGAGIKEPSLTLSERQHLRQRATANSTPVLSKKIKPKTYSKRSRTRKKRRTIRSLSTASNWKELAFVDLY